MHSALLNLSPPRAASEPTAPRAGSPAARLAHLVALFADLNQAEVAFRDKGLICLERGTVLPVGSTVFLAGSPTPQELKQACGQLRATGYLPIVVQDALSRTSGLQRMVKLLADDHHRFQFEVTGAVGAFLRCDQPYQYAFAKADCTATVVVLFDNGTQALTITRLHAPFKGMQAFPGGFLNPGFESLTQCAQREVKEETKVRFSLADILPVDERSNPLRDPRGHVVDHGYVVVVTDPARKRQILSRLKAGDDAEKAGLTQVRQLISEGMAFDHLELLKAALKKAGFKAPRRR